MWFKGESGIVISDILKIASALTLEDFLVTVVKEKYLIQFITTSLIGLQIFQFGEDFIAWIKTILKDK